jgi:uncharacterized MnhB-related membrane protein
MCSAAAAAAMKLSEADVASSESLLGAFLVTLNAGES